MSILLAALVLGQNESRFTAMERTHRHLQSVFNDLAPTKKGVVGVSRVEMSQLKSHGLAGRTVRNSGTWDVDILIFGNAGKPLDPKTVSLRYASPMTATRDLMPFVREAAKAFAGGSRAPMTDVVGGRQFHARAFVLSSKDCLKCHTGMKVGDAVAIGVYNVTEAKRPDSVGP